MKMIQTNSFNLATYSSGDELSEKLALVLPGRLDTKDYTNIRSHTDYLASKEYFAMSFDPPGTWESDGGIEIYSMTNYKKAIDELIEHFNKPTLLMGHSRGGSMAVLAGTRNPSVEGIIAVMSACSYTPEKYGGYPDLEWKKRGYKLHKRDVPGKEGEYREFRLPYSFVEDQKQYDMYGDLAKWNKPKLFVYGEKDELVEADLVKEVYEVATEPKEIASIDAGHDYRFLDEKISDVNEIVGKFLDKYHLV